MAKEQKMDEKERTKWRQMVITNPWCIIGAPDQVKNDGNIMYEAIRKEPLTFEHEGLNVRSSRAIVLEAVKGNGETFMFADPQFRSDKEIVQHATRQYGQYIRYASEE